MLGGSADRTAPLFDRHQPFRLECVQMLPYGHRCNAKLLSHARGRERALGFQETNDTFAGLAIAGFVDLLPHLLLYF
jgi:hypothetical protein